MGKGSATTTTQQQQTYNPTGAPQIQSALTQAQNAAQLPFNIPQAPVAGFSQDQQSAFGNINNAQGMAQPYINQAQQYFSPQGAQQFFNWPFRIHESFYRLDGKTADFSPEKTFLMISSRRSRHLLRRELTVFGFRISA
jgi:hypothetical protein